MKNAMEDSEDCSVCLLPCDKEIHAATLRLRRWCRARLKRAITPVVAGTQSARPKAPGGAFPLKGEHWPKDLREPASVAEAR